MELVQVVPNLPPLVEGVGCYAMVLATEFRDRLSIDGRLVVGDPSWPGEPETKAGLVAKVPARNAGALSALLGNSTVLLHYANYGYHSRGCPLWLIEGLRRWKQGAARRRLITFFHEVYASGPPWRSSFWTSPLQRKLAMTLARRSEGIATSLELYASVLTRFAPGLEVHVSPVFSTVGEPSRVPNLENRTHSLVVFGGPGVRGRAYGKYRDGLEAVCRNLNVEEVLDIGPPLASPPARVGAVPVRELGALPASAVSRLLLDSFAGFLAYPPDFLPKSTIFAAYCAHGLLPVCAWDRHPKQGPVVAGKHYWTGSGDLQAIASAAQDWYTGHSLARQAEQFRRLLAGDGERT